jgi:hypothetical protein
VEFVAAIALTASAIIVWIGQRKWGHPIANPGLYYLGSVLVGFALFRWGIAMWGSDDHTLHFEDVVTLLFITFVQVGIILVMFAGRQFSRTAEERYIQWAREQHLINNGQE